MLTNDIISFEELGPDCLVAVLRRPASFSGSLVDLENSNASVIFSNKILKGYPWKQWTHKRMEVKVSETPPPPPPG